MGKYEDINKDRVIRLCKRVEELEEMQYHYDLNSGEIIHAPDKELDIEKRKLLAEAYVMLRGIEMDIGKDFAELNPFPLLEDKERNFIWSAKKLLDIYHEEFLEKDLTELKKYFIPIFNKKWFDILVTRLNDRDWKKKDLARIAYLIFVSKQRSFNNVGTVFSNWHQKFCEIMGGEYTAEYKPNKLKNDMGDIKDIFYYLLE